MIVWLTKIDGKIRISDREVIITVPEGEPLTIGHPEFYFSLFELQNNSGKYFIQLKEGKSIKMVLREWPIE